MKERQRWTSEEDDALRVYVKQYGASDWHLISQRLKTRDAKSCLERWKNYLKPGIKKGSLTEEEQRVVIQLQAKHGNKWKKIAAEIPGRTAKRLGKWWEVFKERQQREKDEGNKTLDPIEEHKYDLILENFAEKIVKDRMGPGSNDGFLPPWLSTNIPTVHPPSPSVTLTLNNHWIQPDRDNDASAALVLGPSGSRHGDSFSELAECCRELEEGHRAFAAHRKEAAWRLRRVELQLESERAAKRREITDEIELKIRSLVEEQKVRLERVEAEYREQMAVLRRDAEIKEQKLVDQWAVKHSRLAKLTEQTRYRSRGSDSNGH